MAQQHLPDRIKDLLYSHCRTLQFNARKWAEEQSSGNYRSISKGSGIEFEEARLYVPGDDSKRIDWKLSARKSLAYVKSFKEERDLSVYLLIDISNSTLTGVHNTLLEKILEATAFISSIALRNNDMVGAIIFSSDIECYIKPSKSPNTVLNILHNILTKINEVDFAERSTLVNLDTILQKANSLIKRRSLLFVLSDFRHTLESLNNFKSFSKRHQLYSLWFKDSIERFTDYHGLIKLVDPETGNSHIVDLSCKKSKKDLLEKRSAFNDNIEKSLRSARSEILPIDEFTEVSSSLSTFLMKESAKHRHR